MKKFLSVLLTVVMVLSTVCLATVSSPKDFSTDVALDGSVDVQGIAEKILSFIQLVAFAVALGMMLFIGIKYMLAGAGEKAQVKTTFLPYLVGAVCVGSAAKLADFFIGLAGD